MRARNPALAARFRQQTGVHLQLIVLSWRYLLFPGWVSPAEGARAAGRDRDESSLAAGRPEHGYRIFTSSARRRCKLDGGS